MMNEALEKNIDTATHSLIQQCDSLSSQELFRHANTVRIEHAGQTYWLRLTRGNKLILTK